MAIHAMAEDYTIYVGGNDLTLYVPSSPDKDRPDLYGVKWDVYSGTPGAVTFITSTSNPTLVRATGVGQVRISCRAEYYNKANALNPRYSGKTRKTYYYDITCKDSNEGGGSSGGGTSGGGGSSGGGSSSGGLQDNSFFQETTPEGHSMWFYVWTNTYEGFSYKICIVSPGQYTTSCISQSTVGKVTIPEKANSLNVYSIDRNSFYNIAGITEIVIPNTVQRISSQAFLSCSSLKQLTVMGEVPPDAESDSFDGSMFYNSTLYVPKGSKRRYMESNGWKNFKTIKEIGGVDVEGLDISSSNFPDENFRKYLFEQDYGKDGVITDQELNEITSISPFEGWNVSNFKGIEFFENLASLCICTSASVDVSKNMKLERIEIELKIKNEAIESIINTLPLNVYSKRHSFVVDGDWLTSQQISNIRKQGWTPYYKTFENGRFLSNQYPGDDPTDINLLYADIDINVGESFEMGYTLTPSDAVRDVTWSSDDSSIAYVNYEGVLQGYKAGTTYITASAKNGTTRSCKVVVKDPTSIRDIKTVIHTDTPIYNLNGQRLNKPHKGINIIGGKKVFVK